MAQYDAHEKRELCRRIEQGDASPPCPRCGGPCAVVAGGPRRDVSYVRDRVVVRCGTCRRSLAVERGGGAMRADADGRDGGTGRRRGRDGAGGPALGGFVLAVAVAVVAATTGPTPAWGQSSGGASTPCRLGEPCPTVLFDPVPGPVMLELPIGARAVALGGAFWTSDAQVGAIFHHPSLMARGGFGATYQRFDADSRPTDGVVLMSASGNGEWLGGVVGVGVAFMEHGVPDDAAWAWPVGLEASGPSSGSAYVASAGFAREVAGFTFGGAAKAIGLRAGRNKGVTGAVDLSASREVGPATMALTVQNLGPDLRMGGWEDRAAPLAKRVVLGVGAGRTPVGPFDVGGAVQLARTGEGELAVGGGVEVAWWPVLRRVFVARAGVARNPDDRDYWGHWDESGSGYHFSFGGGFEGDRIRLDYAYQRQGTRGRDRVPASHVLGLSFR